MSINQLKYKLRELKELLKELKYSPKKNKEISNAVNNIKKELKYIKKLITNEQYKAYRKSQVKEIEVRRYHTKNKLSYKKNKCVECGNTKKLHLHHEIYDKDVAPLTLCSKCHLRLHTHTRLFRPTFLKVDLNETC